MIDEGRLQDLIDLGQTKGRLSTEDLQEVIPVDTMSLEELAEVILRLERAGIDVEVDPALLEREPGTAARRPALVETLPDSALGTEGRATAAGTVSATTAAPAAPPDSRGVQPSWGSFNVSATVLIAFGIVMFLVLIAVWFL